MTTRTTVRLAGLVGEEEGKRDGRPPVVFLHGFSFSRSMWRPAVDALQRMDPGRHSIAFDLPGHGESPAWATYDVASLADGVHRAVVEGGLDAPVVVGHSLAAIVATVYGARYPTAAVVNVDQPLDTGPFLALLRSVADRLRGPEFPAVWAMFRSSMHMEVLPPDTRALLAADGQPQQALALGYWREALERSPEEIGEMADADFAALRTKKTSYLYVAGSDVSAADRTWLASRLPQVEIAVLPGGGHFPHLAHPDQFAALIP